MRLLAANFGLFCCFFWATCIFELPEPHAAETGTQASMSEVDDWRRTDDGWERVSSWDMNHPENDNGFPTTIDVGRVHPGLLASFVALASLGALLLVDDRQEQDD